jgi:hypothetical protein
VKRTRTIQILIKLIRYFKKGRKLLNDSYYQEGQKQNHAELVKRPTRTEVINFLLSQSTDSTCYLEIGTRDPDDNYNHIVADQKYSVDPRG